MEYSLRKQPEMPEIMSFDDAARVVYRGTQGIEILVDYSPRKQPQMPEIMSIDDAARVVYRGSQGIEIPCARRRRIGTAHSR